MYLITPKVFHYYINHCCGPNAVDVSRNPTNTHYLALRDIGAGEDITTDYGISGSATIAHCRCQSPRCRGQVTPTDWQRPELQQYRVYFPWWLTHPIE